MWFSRRDRVAASTYAQVALADKGVIRRGVFSDHLAGRAWREKKLRLKRAATGAGHPAMPSSECFRVVPSLFGWLMLLASWASA
jgi:hypothetical protein